MSHSLVLGALLLSLVSTQASQPTTNVIAETREVVVFPNEKKGLTAESFCKRALQNPDPNAVIMDSGTPVPVAEYCELHVPYATHSGGKTGNPYIKYKQGKDKDKWLSPTDFCARETAANCDKPIKIIYKGVVANPSRPTKPLGDYCKGYGKDLGCAAQ